MSPKEGPLKSNGEASVSACAPSSEDALKGDAASHTRKVRFWIRALAFVGTVITLSWFFEGTRQIQGGLNVSSVSYLVFGTILTIALIVLQAFWIYVEEKSKGTLMRRVKLFDKLDAALQSGKRGDDENRD